MACGSCRAWTTLPQPSDHELARAYEGWYRPDAGRFAGPAETLLRRLRGRLARRIDRIAPAGPVLDVGSGEGALLDALEAKGRACRGLERSPDGDDRIDGGTIEAVAGEWACVVFWHSLEHLPRAGAALDRAAGLLAPGGVLIVAMPNIASLQARVFGDRWFALELPRHLVHVPAAELRRRIEAGGLEVERISQLRGGQVAFGWLHGLVGMLPGSPDLYDAIRRPGARRRPLGRARRAGVLGAAVLLLAPALAMTAVEAALRRGGTVYIEARRV